MYEHKENRYLVFDDCYNITEWDADDIADLIDILEKEHININEIFQITKIT